MENNEHEDCSGFAFLRLEGNVPEDPRDLNQLCIIYSCTLQGYTERRHGDKIRRCLPTSTPMGVGRHASPWIGAL